MEKKCDSRVVYSFFWIAKIDYLVGNWNFESILEFPFVAVPLLILNLPGCRLHYIEMFGAVTTQDHKADVAIFKFPGSKGDFKIP